MTPDAMAALHAACFTVPRPWTAAEFAGMLADPLVLVLAEPAVLLVGRVVAGEAEVLTLAVHPQARSQGLARQMLAEFHRLAQGRGAGAVFLEVAADNDAAIGLYRGAGYLQAGRRSSYYRMPDGHQIDALVLRQDFHPA